MPQLGESVAEGTIGKWLKKPGDYVARYEPLLEVITDKVNAEVPSPFEGVLTEILVQEGDTVPNNAEIAVIDEAGATSAGDGAAAPAAAASAAAASAAAASAPAASGPAGFAAAAPAAPPASAAPSAAPSAEAAAPQPVAPAPTPQAAAPAPAPAVAGALPTVGVPSSDGQGDSTARMSPAVRRLLREHGLTASQIRGSGAGGRVTRDDVQAFLAVRTSTGAPPQEADRAAAAAPPPSTAPAPPQASPAQPPAAAPAPVPAPAQAAAAPAAATPAAPPRAPLPAPVPVAFEPGQDELLIPWSQMRRGIATAMVRSKTSVPHASTVVEVDATNLVRLRAAHKESFRAREGMNLSFVPFIVKAVVEALRRHPRINGHWTEGGLLVKRRINVGIAVALEDGLIVPVVHDADQLSISGLNRAILDVADRARNNRLRLDDLQGGTITINNTGTFGSIVSNSIINTPEVAIVNLEAIVKRPVVLETDEGDVIAIRSLMNLPVAFDHRSTDGAQIGRFAGDIKAWIEAIGPETPIY
jgi:2-oxoisovalerate dehydrogenase E2 component (dihydrolipoyl transacylase)